jgi:hypothetical protein
MKLRERKKENLLLAWKKKNLHNVGELYMPINKESTLEQVNRAYSIALSKDPRNPQQKMLEFLGELLEDVEWAANNPLREFFRHHPEIFGTLKLETTVEFGLLLPPEAERALRDALTNFQTSPEKTILTLLDNPTDEILSPYGLTALKAISLEQLEFFSQQKYKGKTPPNIIQAISNLGAAIHAQDRKLLKNPELQAVIVGMIKAAGQDYTPRTHPDFPEHIRRAINQGVRGAFSRKQSTLFAGSKDEATQAKAKWYDHAVQKITEKENVLPAQQNPKRPSG